MDSLTANGDARDDALVSFRVFVLLLCGVSTAFADGGTIQFRQSAGSFVITLFSEPTPVRAGQANDLSVLCERANGAGVITEAQVLIHLRRPGAGDIMEFALPAKRSKTDKGVLFAAGAKLPSAGKWPVRIDVRAGGDEAMVSGVLDVQPPQPAIMTYWPFFVAVPLLALVFAINLRLRRGRKLRHPRAIQ